MIEVATNLWESLEDVDAVVLTVGGDVKKDGHAILGRGSASEASNRFPHLTKHLGAAIRARGNHVYVFPMALSDRCRHLITFPVKAGDAVVAPGTHQNRIDAMVLNRYKGKFGSGQIIPGCRHRADIKWIRKSASELFRITTAMRWEKVAMPKPGCSEGELAWEVVKLTLADVLGPDPRFIVYENPKEE